MTPPARRLIVFLSSVRRSLEEERDNLCGLIQAIGNECIRFEDFTAQPVPSRQACLSGVDQADVYVLLLGCRYGEPLVDSGRSPTEEEFTRARQRGIPILAFVKQGVDFEPRQEAFVGRVEEYTGGRFRQSFTNAADLQPKVASALTDLAVRPAPLVFAPLPSTAGTSLTVPWIYQPSTGGSLTPWSAILECHVIPLDVPRVPAASLDALGERLAALGREHRLFRTGEALDVTHAPESMGVRSVNRDQKAGLTVQRNGTISVWTDLERDWAGHIVEASNLADQIAQMLRLAAELVSGDRNVALAAGLGPTDHIVEGHVSDLGRRTEASLGFNFGRETPIRAEPEDSVPASALPQGSQEIGRELAARLLRQFRATRR